MEAICKSDFDLLVAAKERAEKLKGSKIPKVGYHDCYGIWFLGEMVEIIRVVGLDKFEVNLEKTMHVFIDEDPQKITAGIHVIGVYGHECRLYKWQAQGYHRGLVVLASDETGCAAAQVYMESGTWSWLLNDDDKAKLPPEAGSDDSYKR